MYKLCSSNNLNLHQWIMWKYLICTLIFTPYLQQRNSGKTNIPIHIDKRCRKMHPTFFSKWAWRNPPSAHKIWEGGGEFSCLFIMKFFSRKVSLLFSVFIILSFDGVVYFSALLVVNVQLHIKEGTRFEKKEPSKREGLQKENPPLTYLLYWALHALIVLCVRTYIFFAEWLHEFWLLPTLVS